MSQHPAQPDPADDLVPIPGRVVPWYDAAGNYRQNFNSGSSRLVYTHDAWNRLVRLVRASGGFASGARGRGRVT